MNPVELVSEGLKSASRALEDESLVGQRTALDGLLAMITQKVLTPLPAALAELAAADQARLSSVAAWTLCNVSGAFAAADRASDATRLLVRAEELRTDDAAEFAARRRALPTHAKLWRARWLLTHEKPEAADALLQPITRDASEPVLQAVAVALRSTAKKLLDAPQPITSAPPLFTLNGVGTGMYGHADEHPDGSYIATLCLCLIFIPVFPLTSYRVWREGNSYRFLGKVRLGSGWVWYRRLLGVGALCAVLVNGVGSYLSSPNHQASVAADHAQQLENEGKNDEAMKAYGTALETWGFSASASSLTPMTEGWLRLRLKAVHAPITAEQVPEIERLVLRYESLAAAARNGKPNAMLAAQLQAWAQQLGSKRRSDADASLHVLDLAVRVASADDARAISTQVAALRTEIADGLRAQWPMQAFEHYVKAGSVDEKALLAASSVLGELGDSPSVYEENAAAIETWLVAASSRPALTQAAVLYRKRMDEALKLPSAPGRNELLSSGDEKRLLADRKQFPLDQGTAVAIAVLQRDRGDTAKAAATLDALGPVGHLSSDALLVRATVHLQAEEPQKAGVLLAAYLDLWRPRFLDAKLQLEQGAAALEKRLIAEAREGQLPADINKQLDDAHDNKERVQEIFGAWLDEKMATDVAVAKLRDGYQRRLGVVSAALMLGSLQLAQANAAAPEERKVLLADAERTFLSVRQEADDKPALHLGLGQVFHRLGKTEEGDHELMGLLQPGEWGTQQQVAEIYRELGVIKRSREIYEDVFDKAPGATRDASAVSLSMLSSNPDDAETWLSKVSSKTPEIQTRLAQMKATREELKGNHAEADRLYAQVAAFYDRTSARDSTAANNAAVAYSARFGCTGDPAMMDKAIAAYELAARLAPENAVTLSNLSSTLARRGRLSVLEKWLHVRALKPTGEDTRELLDTMLDGPLRADVLAALKASPHLRRVIDLCHKLQILSPRDSHAYELELGLLSTLEDTAAMSELKARVDRAGGFDSTLNDEGRAQWEAGKLDGLMRTMTKERLTQIAPLLSDPHLPTRSAALAIKASALTHLSDLDSDQKGYAEVLQTLKSAHAAWKDLGVPPLIVGSLLRLAAERTRTRSPAFDAELKQGWRTYSSSTLVYRAAKVDAAAVEACRQQPEFREAVALAASLDPSTLMETGWILAELANDDALRTRSSKAIKASSSVQRAELLAALEPTSPNNKARLELTRAASR